jgi:uncharacterized protein (DUF1330 family)
MLCIGAAVGAAAIQGLHAQSKPMAYTFAEFEVTDPTNFKTYGDATGAGIPAAGGKFVVRAGKTHVVGGEAPKRVVLIEWPSFDQAHAYFESAAYKQLVENRDKSAKFRAFVIEGAEK